MVKKSILLSALDAHKGRDFDKERQKKLQKAAAKKKRTKAAAEGEEVEDNDEVEKELVCLSSYDPGFSLIWQTSDFSHRRTM